MTDPRNLKKWLIIIAVLYLVFPRDLIPDFLGSGLGLIDDFSLMALLTYFYRNPSAGICRSRNAGRAEDRIGESIQVAHKRRPPEVRLIPMRSWALALRHPEKRFTPPTKPACMNTIQTRWLTWVRSCKRSLIVKAVEIQQAYEQLRK